MAEIWLGDPPADRSALAYSQRLSRACEPPEPPPATAQRAGLVEVLRGLGCSQRHIAGRLGVSEQTVSQMILRGLEAGRD